MDKKIFERMLNHFDEHKIEEKYNGEDVGMWAEGLVKATSPYYKYCNSQWRARVHRQIEYDTYLIILDFKKLKNENTNLLDENRKLQQQVGRLVNNKVKLESQVRKLKN